MTNLHRSIPPALIPAHARFLRQPEVIARVGVSWATLARWEGRGIFPKRHRIGPNTVAWLESEIDNWCAQRTVDTARALGAV